MRLCGEGMGWEVAVPMADSPVLGSKAGSTGTNTWCRKRGLLFILMVPDSSPLK